MCSLYRHAVLGLAAMLALGSAASAQSRPYIGYVYPAGGQHMTTFRVKIGGQNLDGASGVVISGRGVTGKVVEFLRRIGPQETTLLRDQMAIFKKQVPAKSWDLLMEATAVSDDPDNDIGRVDQATLSRLAALGVEKRGAGVKVDSLGIDPKIVNTVVKIRTRMAEYVQRPASAAIASLVIAEITVGSDAQPGKYELRIVGDRGVSNPMPFHVGHLKEFTVPAMLTSEQQVLGKEALALLRRRHLEGDRRITVPCAVNGQIATGEVHRYRFAAKAGQQLVMTTSARELVPFVADAVPGWFQPVLAVYDTKGKEVAYNDRFYYNPDPLVMFKVPKDGEYVMVINDAIYRGREDFVYRVTIDESPLVTGIFPLGARFGTSPPIAMTGWNLEGATLGAPLEDSLTGYHILKATKGRLESNPVLFAPDTLPECLDTEPNNDAEHAQKVQIPVIVNGRIDRRDDSDVFQFAGHAGQTIVAEVKARQLNSPLDSVLQLTDAKGKLLAINDDYEDPEAGTNTHHADSYLRVKLPADGTYYLHLGDITRAGGPEYAYRLRISHPRPDFALRMMPSSVFLRPGGSDSLSVFVSRKDGFAEPIELSLKDPPKGITCGGSISGTEPVDRVTFHADSDVKPGLYNLVVQGKTKIGAEEVIYEAVGAEDRMQAFLWRHLVPAQELKACVPDPNAEVSRPRPKRAAAAKTAAPKDGPGAKAKFTPQQVEGRLRQLDLLFKEGLISEAFYKEKVAECEAGQ